MMDDDEKWTKEKRKRKRLCRLFAVPIEYSLHLKLFSVQTWKRLRHCPDGTTFKREKIEEAEYKDLEANQT